MTTNSLFMLSLIIIVVLSVFVGVLAPDAGSFADYSDSTSIGAPSVWDVITFAASTFWSMLTFGIAGLPWAFGVFFWVIVFINLWCLIRLIRGVA